MDSENVTRPQADRPVDESADNQQETPIYLGGSSETTRETPQITKAYLLGAIRDATRTKYTYRLSQKGCEYPNMISQTIKSWGKKAWVYKEGKNRDVFVVEFSAKILEGIKVKSRLDKIEFIQGYFDAEGSVSRLPTVRYYIYFGQKDLVDLELVKSYLSELGILCGKTHNPSRNVDPDYWRFYISSKSYNRFYRLIGSSHPMKGKYLRKMI